MDDWPCGVEKTKSALLFSRSLVRIWDYDKLDEVAPELVDVEISPPPVVIVESPNGQPKCAGRFALIPDELANGKPLWRKQAADGAFEDRWIYYSIKKTWNIGGRKARQTGFSTHSAFIFGETTASRGDYPHQVTRTWWLATPDHKFKRDPCIVVQAALTPPPQLPIEPAVGPSGQTRRATVVGIAGFALLTLGLALAFQVTRPHEVVGLAGLSPSECEAVLNDPAAMLSVFLECKGVQQEEAAAGRTLDVRPRRTNRQAAGRRLPASPDTDDSRHPRDLDRLGN